MISNEELLKQTEDAIAKEKSATLVVVKLFLEIESRMLYAERGYSSLFEMATKYFGYSEGEAYRRVAAMRLLKEAPELETKIEDGSLSLTVAAQVRAFCKKNKKDVREIAAKVEGKSSREAERELLRIVPQSVPQERVRQVTEDVRTMTIALDRDLQAALDELMALRAHANPGMSYTELIRQLASLGKKTWGHHQRNTTSAPMSDAEARRDTHREAGGQCEYQDPLTGRRCEAQHFLEIDHIRPRALGGRDERVNLRILCRTHNQLAAVQKLGRSAFR